ncbi:MAG: YkgJ family cysteine cluster protein [Candidatus Hodarchaeota archaeon]
MDGHCDGRCCFGGGSIFIYAEDILRFMKYFNVELKEFIEKYTKIEKTYCGSTEHRSLIPVVTIKEKERGACIFLSDEGTCSVHDNHPIQCKLYPFWDLFCSSEKDWQKLQKKCPGIDEKLVHDEEYFYPPEKIEELVALDKKNEEDWEKAMIKWDDDYIGFLKDYMKKKGMT